MTVALAAGGHLIPFSFFHDVTFTGLPCIQVVMPWCAVPLNWTAVPDFGIFPLKKKVVGITAFGIDENVATAFDCVLDAAGTTNSLRLSCRLVRRLSNHGSAKTQKQEKSKDHSQLADSSWQDDSK